MTSLAGKVALVTGAARGQGRSHALRLARDGADIIAVDLLEPIEHAEYPAATRADLDETAELVAAQGQRVVAAKADVRDYDELAGVVDSAVAELGSLDIVVANAGILTAPSPAHEMPEDVWSNMIDTNLSGVWRTAKVAIPHLRDGGSIIITSSVAGLKAYGNIAHYVSAKHGVVGLARTLAIELAPRFIRVNTIHPSQVATPMIMNEAEYRIFRPDLEHPTREDFAAASQAVHALPEPWLESEDISNAVAFLASDESRCITGVALPVDLGCLLGA